MKIEECRHEMLLKRDLCGDQHWKMLPPRISPLGVLVRSSDIPGGGGQKGYSNTARLQDECCPGEAAGPKLADSRNCGNQSSLEPLSLLQYVGGYPVA